MRFRGRSGAEGDFKNFTEGLAVIDVFWKKADAHEFIVDEVIVNMIERARAENQRVARLLIDLHRSRLTDQAEAWNRRRRRTEFYPTETVLIIEIVHVPHLSWPRLFHSGMSRGRGFGRGLILCKCQSYGQGCSETRDQEPS